MTPNDALKNLIALVSNVADAHTTALYVLDNADNTLKLRDHLTLSPRFSPQATIPLGEGLIGKVVADHEAILKDFSDSDPPSLEMYSEPEDLKGFLALPVADGNIRGALVVDSKEEYTFSTKLQKMLTGFADQAAWHLTQEMKQPAWVDSEPEDFSRMVKWCRFLAEAPDRKTLSERLMHIPKNILPMDAQAIIWFKSDGTGKVTRARGWASSIKELTLKGGVGVCGSCENTGEPVLVPNTQKPGFVLFAEGEDLEPYGSVIVAPIVTEKRLQGLVVCARDQANSLTRVDLDRLTLMTAFGALALDAVEIRNQWEVDKNMCQVTGIPNHRFLSAHLNSIERMAFQEGRSSSLLTLQIKNLVAIYETYGLETGDRFLELAVNLILDSVPEQKFIFRHSENILVILLMGVKPEDARNQQEQLEVRFQNETFAIDGNHMKPNIHFGLASFPEDGKQLGDLIGSSWSRASQAEERTHV